MNEFEKFMASDAGRKHQAKAMEDLIYHKKILPETTAAMRKDMDEYLIKFMEERLGPPR